MKQLCLLIFCCFALTACTNTLSGTLSNAWQDTVTRIQKADWSLFGGNPKPVSPPLSAAAETTTACPRVNVVPDLARIVEFQGQTLISQTQFTGVSRVCSATQTAVNVTISIEFTGQLGEQGVKDAKIQANYTYPYLMAVVNPAGQIVAKDVFAMTAIYQKGQNSGVFRETITQTIPFSAVIRGQNPADYHIQLGFQLSPAQLAYNRAYK